MSMKQLMSLVPIEAASTLNTTHQGRRSRWERTSETGTSRFGPKDDKPFLPPPFVDLPPGLTPLQVDQFLREQRLDELTLKLERGELEFGDPDIRPPSPPPAYDKNGNRTNTRDVRVRNAMTSEHQRLLEYMIKTVPGFVPPPGYKPVKKIRRIIIPQEKYPEYNFMGLIIGPRGCNHKRLEAESGAQISIRGRGTQKEGKKTDHQTEEEAAMPQHVHIAADTEDSLDKAVSLIEPLLNPRHPAHEEFKKKGLEQLAMVNGVSISKFESKCSVCGATGHTALSCQEMSLSFVRPDIKCLLCGDKGHVTMDCKLARGMSNEQLSAIEKKAQSSAASAAAAAAAAAAVAGNLVVPKPAYDNTRIARTRLDIEYTQMMSELESNNTTTRTGMDPLDAFTKPLEQPTYNLYGNPMMMEPYQQVPPPEYSNTPYYNAPPSEMPPPPPGGITYNMPLENFNATGTGSGGGYVDAISDYFNTLGNTLTPQQQMQQISQLMGTLMAPNGQFNSMSAKQMEQLSQIMSALYPTITALSAAAAATAANDTVNIQSALPTENTSKPNMADFFAPPLPREEEHPPLPEGPAPIV